MAFLVPSSAVQPGASFFIASYASTFAARPSRAIQEHTCSVMAVSPKAFEVILAVRLVGNLSLTPSLVPSPQHKCLLSIYFAYTTNAPGKERVVDWTATLIRIAHTSPSSVLEKEAAENAFRAKRWLHISSLPVSKTVRTPRPIQKEAMGKTLIRVTSA